WPRENNSSVSGVMAEPSVCTMTWSAGGGEKGSSCTATRHRPVKYRASRFILPPRPERTTVRDRPRSIVNGDCAPAAAGLERCARIYVRRVCRQRAGEQLSGQYGQRAAPPENS